MNKIIAEFEKGSEADPIILLTGVVIIISSFLTLHDTDIWQSREELWLPMMGVGCALIILNMFVRLFRKNLIVELISNDEESITIQPVKNLQFSGWVKKPLIKIQKQSIKSVKVYDFYSTGSHAGMYWVCFTFNSNHIVEFNIDDLSIVKDIIEFIKTYLCNVDLILDERIKSNN
jgi:hypothetical protein